VSARVVGVGNPFRGDDAAGLAVARRLAAEGYDAIERDGEPAALVDALGGEQALVVVDAVRSGAPPGTLVRWDASAQAVPLPPFRGSTHALGLAEAIELARTLRRLAPRVVVYGIEGEDFGAGERLTPAALRGVEEAVEAVRGELQRLAGEEGGRCTSGR